MKKLLLTIATTLWVASTTTVQAQQRSTHELDSIANSVFTTTSGARSVAAPMRMAMRSSQVLKADSLTTREAFYVYTPQSGEESFVIVSGDERMPAVLGYSDESLFNADSLPEGLKWFLRKCEHDAYLLSKQKPEMTQAIRAKNLATTKVAAIQTRATNSVAPLLGGRIWNQGDPFNKQCPRITGWTRAVTGCGATAMAQIMAHHKYPDKGTGWIYYTTETEKLTVNLDLDSETPYDWANMLDSYENFASYNTTQANAVAQLMYHAGAAIKTDYTDEGSNSSTFYVSGALHKNFKYDDAIRLIRREDYSTEQWHETLKNELLEGRPVFYRGNDYSGESGHAFVFDGFNEEGLYHVNWGWSGTANGYYNIYDLTPEELGIGSGAYGDYSYNCSAVINIRPDDGIAMTEPTNMAAYSIKSANGIGIMSKDQEISLTMKNFKNLSYNTFRGEVQLMLVYENDNTHTLLGKPIELLDEDETLETGRHYNTFNISAPLPTILSNGKYRLYVGVRQDGYTEWGTVKSYISGASTKYDYLEVVVKDGLYTLGTGKDPGEATYKLTVDNIGVDEGLEGTINRYKKVYPTTSWIQFINNEGDLPYTGTVSMMLSDENGENLKPFGEAEEIAALSPYDYDLAFLEDALPDSLPNGKYRLYFGSMREGTDTWEIIENSDTTLQSYITIVIKDSHMRLGMNYEEPEYGFSTLLADTVSTYIAGKANTYTATLKVSNNFDKALPFSAIVVLRDESRDMYETMLTTTEVQIPAGHTVSVSGGFSLSSELPMGTYTVYYYLNTDGTILCGDYQRAIHTFTIDGDPNQPPYVVAESITFEKMETAGRSNLLTIKAYDMKDIYHATFNGQIAGVITDISNNVVMPLDYTYYYDYSYTDYIYGRIPESLPNGMYRLHIGYLPEGSEEWKLVNCTDEESYPYTILVVKDSHITLGTGYDPKHSFKVEVLEATTTSTYNGEYKAKLSVTNTGRTSTLEFRTTFILFPDPIENEEGSYRGFYLYDEEAESYLSSLSILQGETKTIEINRKLENSSWEPYFTPGKYHLTYLYKGDDDWLSLLHDGKGRYAYHEIEIGADPEGIEEVAANHPTSWATLHQEGETFTLKSHVGLTGWDIISTLGSIVAQSREDVETGSTTTIDLSTLPTGIYQLRGFGKDGKVHVLKFLKQ